MKYINFFVKVSLISIMLLGILRLEAHSVRAQDTNPPPAVENTDGSAPATDDGVSAGDTAGDGSDSADSATASDSSAADEDPAGSSTTPDEAASSPPDTTTSPDEAASSPPDTSAAPDDPASSPPDASTAPDDATSSPPDASTAPDEAASSPPDASASPDDPVSSPEDTSTSPDEAATDLGDSSTAAEILEEAAEILEEAAEKDITLADGSGEPLSAADAETQQLLSSPSSDPWFVADDGTKVGYTSGGSCSGMDECHPNETNSIQAAISDARSAGKEIHIENGDYSGEEFTLDDDTRSFNLSSDVSVKTINLNTAYDFVTEVVGGVFSALEVWLNFGGAKTATIQDGVNLTESGGKLSVASKTYNENVIIDATKDGIHIAGDHTPILDGSGIGPVGIDIAADNVSISGLKIQSYSSSGISLTNGSLNVAGSTFAGNYIGIHIGDASTLTSQGNLYEGNTMGIYSSASTLNSDADTFQNYPGDGIRSLRSSLNIAGSTFQGNMAGINMDSSTLTSQGNLYSGNLHGLYSCYSQANISGDVFQNNTDIGIFARDSSLDVGGSTFQGNEHVIIALGSSLDVAGSTFQGNGDGIHIEGASTLTSQGNLYEGNTNGLISADSSVDSAGDTFRANTEDGILSSNSSLNVSGSTFQGNEDGIHIEASSTLTSQGNLYEGNWTGLYSSDSTVTSSGDRFLNNSDGAYLEDDTEATFSDGIFDDNLYGISAYDTKLNATRNFFTSNIIGVDLADDSEVSLSNNTFGDALDPTKMNMMGIFADGSGSPPGGSDMLTSHGDQFFQNLTAVFLMDGASASFSGDVFEQNVVGITANSASSLTSQSSRYSNNDVGLSLQNSTATSANDTFQDNPEGIVAEGSSNLEVSGSTFSGNDYGVSIYDTSALNSHGNTYTGNGAGVEVYDDATATITYDNFEDNGRAILSENPDDTEAHFNRFYNNGVGIVNISGGAGYVHADNNWWGDNQGAAGKTVGNVDFSDWLALDITASKDPILTGGDTSQLTTQMVGTDGAAKIPLSALDLAAIQANWFKYTSALNLQTPGMGTLNGDTFTSGNQSGDALFSDTKFDDQTPTTKVTIIDPVVPPPGNPPMIANPGSPDALAPLEQVVIPVTGDSLVNLFCGSASQLLLPNGNYILIPALEPCTMQASLQPEVKEALPGPLPDGVQFVDGLAVTLVDNGGNALDVLPQEALLQVNFSAPQPQANASLAVYWWDGNAWQEVLDSGLGVAESNNTGLFVLVMK